LVKFAALGRIAKVSARKLCRTPELVVHAFKSATTKKMTGKKISLLHKSPTCEMILLGIIERL